MPLTHVEDAALGLLPELYTCRPDGWSRFLDRLSALTGSGLAAVHRYDFRRRRGDFEHGVHAVEERFRDEYKRYYSPLNPYVRGARRRLRTDRAVLGSELLPLSRLERTEFYCDFLRPQELHHSIGIVALTEPTANVSLTALRSRRRGPYTETEQRLFTLLGPHLLQALRLRRRLGAMESTLQGLSDALDRMPQGAILLDGRDRPLLVNRRAGELLARDDGLALGAEGLTAARSDGTAALRRLLHRRGSEPGDRLDQAGGTLRLARPSHRPPLSLLVVHPQLDRPSADPAVADPGDLKLVFVSDPDGAPRTAQSVLRDLFGLTTAEARVTGLLLRGRSVTEAADELGVSRNTLRTHLKRIFAKTGTHRQAELVRLCLRSVAGLAKR